MEPPSTSLTAIPRRISLNNDASLRPNGATAPTHHSPVTHQRFPTSPPQTEDGEIESASEVNGTAFNKLLNCDRRRPEEEQEDKSRLVNMSSSLAGKTVTPFLREHVPSLYAPVSKIESAYPNEPSRQKEYNSKYCYRHRPDSKCRKAADENKMAMIQSVCRSVCLLICMRGPRSTNLTDTGIGTRKAPPGGPTSYHTRLESLFCCTVKAQRVDDPGYSIFVLLPSTESCLSRGPVSTKDRLHFRAAQRDLYQDPIFP
jgi:hypothetical protein